jgi:hypothetical protein
MYEQPEALLGIFDEETIQMPIHSRLYHLEPIGIGTPFVESLTSYVVRLAEAHSVSPRIVVTPENWTPGKVKARRYTRTKKGVHDDTTTNISRRI